MLKNQRNKEGDLEGYWEYYYPNGKLRWKGNYINGREMGYWEEYDRNGKLIYIEYFF